MAVVSERTRLRLEKRLTMFKNILQVRELVVLELELDELCGGRSLEVGTRSELVGHPELSVSHDTE
jgi:hypothetical protein